MGRADVAAQLNLRHALAQGRQSRAKRFDSDVVGALHQRDFRWRLEHPAAGGHRRREDDLRGRRCLRDAVGDEEAHALLDADLRGRYAAILQDAENRCPPVLVFLPDADVLGERRELSRAGLLEAGADVRQLALLWDHEQERPLAESPPDVHEVAHARARFEHDGADVVLGHQASGLLDATQALLIGDRRCLAGKRLERADALRHGRRRAGLRASLRGHRRRVRGSRSQG